MESEIVEQLRKFKRDKVWFRAAVLQLHVAYAILSEHVLPSAVENIFTKAVRVDVRALFVTTTFYPLS